MNSGADPEPTGNVGVARVIRLALGVLALTEIGVGGWQLFAPHSFYAFFPAGQGWVRRTGAYDQHLVTDLGELTLAMGALLASAAVVFERRLVQIALIAYLVQAVPHLVFHAIHREHLSTADNVANLATLGLAVVLPAALLWLTTHASQARPDRETAARSALGSR